MLDMLRLAAWMDSRHLGSGPIEDVESITGGTQNQVMRFRRGRESFVVRAGPVNPSEGTEEAMRREAQVLQALGDSSVPVPRLLAAESDASVLDQVFYLMAPVDGRSITQSLDLLDRATMAKRRVGFALVEALAQLRAVDYIAVGLDGFGRPAGFLERQVDRWSKQLASYSTFPGYPGPGVELGALESWLEANRPSSFRAGVMHGDFHLGNVLFTEEGEVAAIVDWELSTIGDPLLDFAQLLVTWPAADQRCAFGGFVPAAHAGGFAARDELVDAYRSATGCDLVNLGWYCALAAYRIGVVIEGTNARASAGLASPEVGRNLHDSALFVWESALRFVEDAREWSFATA